MKTIKELYDKYLCNHYFGNGKNADATMENLDKAWMQKKISIVEYGILFEKYRKHFDRLANLKAQQLGLSQTDKRK